MSRNRQSVGPTLTIAATTKGGPLVGYAAVAYKSGAYATATIGGSITGAVVGEVVKLYAQPFPYKKAAVLAGSTTLSSVSAPTPYSFSATPAVATRYQAELFASASAATPLATSAVQNVYVLSGGTVAGIKKCAVPTCHEAITITIVVPASTLAIEMAKHVYPYFAVNVAASNAPAPKWLYLNGGSAKVSKTAKVAAEKFKLTISFTFKVGRASYYWDWTACSKDSVTVDGLGLPGHHGCGNAKVGSTAYLG